MTVAIALAENLHHSRQKVEGDEHDGVRAQKTARVTGAWPCSELVPLPGAVTVGYVTAPGPLLVPPESIEWVDTLDDANGRLLLAGTQSLLKRQELQEMEDSAKSLEEQRLKSLTVEEVKALRK